MDGFEQAPVRKGLKAHIKLPVVLYILILEFVGPYEWSDLKHIPRGITHRCRLGISIEIHGGSRWLQPYLDEKIKVIYVTRWDRKSSDRFARASSDRFTFTLLIHGKSHKFSNGVIESARTGNDTMVFKTGRFSSIVFRQWYYPMMLI